MLLTGKKPKYKRESGILLALSSLPSKYGMGSFGEEAFKFVDFLKESRQTYWQLLPLCPLGKGNSPYSSSGTFAGEILYIDIDNLVSNGLLSQNDIPERHFGKNTDYSAVRNFKLPLLKKAADNFNVKNKEFINFKKKNKYWLNDYCLFSAIKECEAGLPFNKWEEPLKYRLPDAIKDFESKHKEEILFFEITQFLFYAQFGTLKNYCRRSGIKLVGDIPFYVSLDSADVFGNPDCFRLGRDMTPILEAGVPPDRFSSEGQLWGNPIYDWNFQRKNGFIWWKNRILHYCDMFDAIRIDHFRAFADYYALPFGSKNAKTGTWEKGVGMSFWDIMKPLIKNTEIFAEDLGEETAELKKLVEESGFPSMKVLQFAFSSDLKNKHLPKNYNKNCVCYTGTHDNDTSLGWYEKANKKEKLLFSRLVPEDKSGSPVLSLIAYAMKSKARIVIIPLQDYLQLPSKCRMNTPGSDKGNWAWRFSAEDTGEEQAKLISRLSGRRNR